MRLLLVEDNIELCSMMKQGLEQAGFQIDTAYDGRCGEEKAYANAYDLIVLDLNLPEKDGLEILKFLRSQQIETPVIIVTARDEIEERALGLDLGADDYLIKPFQMLELRARIQAVIRRFYGRSNPEIVLGDLCICPATRTAKWQGQLLPLAVKEFDILEYIAEKHPAVVSSEELIEHIYNEAFDPFSTVLRVHISKLRKKLYEAAGHHLLATMRGKGYYLWVEE